MPHLPADHVDLLIIGGGIMGLWAAVKAERLGIGCPPGRHVDWPARSWATEYDSPQASEARRTTFDSDIATDPAAGGLIGSNAERGGARS